MRFLVIIETEAVFSKTETKGFLHNRSLSIQNSSFNAFSTCLNALKCSPLVYC